MRRVTFAMLMGFALLCSVVWSWNVYFSRPDEIVFKLGEPYVQVRERSGNLLPSREPAGGPLPMVVAKFRFDDPVYGFVTPRAVLLEMSFDGPDNSEVDSVYLSPHLKPLSLNDALSVAIHMQNQLLSRGWLPFRYQDWRPIEDTAQFRSKIQSCQFPMSVWNAGKDTYQVSIKVGCAMIPQPVGKERYEVTVELGKPFWKDDPRLK
jgi:hypothetical protein